MQAWQYGAVPNGLENSLKLNPSAPIPQPKDGQHLIKIHSMSLNPVDYKPAEVRLARRFMYPKIATPGCDYSGTIVQPAKGSKLKAGDKVFGVAPSPFGQGVLAEYAVVNTNGAVAVPKDLSMTDAATIGTASLTAMQSIQPHVSKGSRLFLNGGSGGVGIVGIQIAKILGCDVTVTCSGRNAELCRGVGADKIIDYTQGDVVSALTLEKKYDHVVDNVGGNWDLYSKSASYAKPSAKLISVAGEPSLSYMYNSKRVSWLPSILGGSSNTVSGIFAAPTATQLSQIGDWIATGEIKAVIDSEYDFKDALEAFRKLKTGRARGKIVVHVSDE